MNKLRNMWAAILKISTGSWLCLVSKVKDKNKTKTFKGSADSDISLKCILYWQTRKGITLSLWQLWVSIHFEIKMNQNGKTRFTSWRKSMTEFKFYNQLDPGTKDIEI